MNRSPTRDFMVGLVVLAGLAAAACSSMSIGGFSFQRNQDFILYAAFDETGGLKVRAPVVIAGVKVGEVESIRLDNEYRARVQMALRNGLKLPIDTSASIVTAGLLGDRYVSLQPGRNDKDLKQGDEIQSTESAVLLEQLIGNLIYGNRGQ